MSSDYALDLALLKALGSELRRAAYDLREVDAFVQYRPDLRRIETEREAHRVILDPCEALKYAAEMELEIPGGRFVDGPPGSVYWMDWVFPNGVQEPGEEAIWEFALFGPPAFNRNDIVIRTFDLVASEATKLILHDHGRGDSAQSSWLIHLADRDQPSAKSDPRRFLRWQEKVTSLRRPWRRLPRGLDSTSHWWAARLTNVFGLSLLAVEQAISADDSGTLLRETQPKRGGRPRVGEGKRNREAELAKKNVYNLIRSRKKTGQGPQTLLPLLRADKDLLNLIKQAGLKLDKRLILAATREPSGQNPDHKT